jgi:hypothetical protein
VSMSRFVTRLVLGAASLLLLFPVAASASSPPIYEETTEFHLFENLVTGPLSERAKRPGPDPTQLFEEVRDAREGAEVRLDEVIQITYNYYRDLHDAETARLLRPLEGIRDKEITSERRAYLQRLARVNSRHRTRIERLRRQGNLTPETRTKSRKLWRSERKTAWRYRRQGIVLARLDFQQNAIPIQEMQYDAWILMSDIGPFGVARDQAKVAYWDTFNLARTLIEEIDSNARL